MSNQEKVAAIRQAWRDVGHRGCTISRSTSERRVRDDLSGLR